MSLSATQLADYTEPMVRRERVLARQILRALICLPLCLLFAGMLANSLGSRERLGSRDFLQEWTSAQNWRTGRAIYAPLHETLSVYFGPGARAVVDLNGHPPTAVVLALPLARLPYYEAWLWWNVASLAALTTGLWLLLGRRGLNAAPLAWVPFFLLVLSSNSLKEQVQQGQLNGWLLLLLTGAWLGDRKGRSWSSGACIGAAAAIKLFPGFLILYCIARRDWKACLAAAGSWAALSLLTGLTLGWSACRDYVTVVLPTLGQFRGSWLNASLVGFWTKLLAGKPDQIEPLFAAPGLAQLAIVITAALIVAAVFWTAWVAKSQQARDVAFAVTTIGMLLVSPITWDHYFLLLLPAIAILWQAQGEAGKNRALLGILAVLLLTIRPGWIFALLIPGNGEFAELLGLPPALVQPWQALTALSYLCYALLALFWLAVYTGWTTDRASLSLTTNTSVRS
jgi:alpha-1,2-mannosyltransferase